jgi:hypothetical protein
MRVWVLGMMSPRSTIWGTSNNRDIFFHSSKDYKSEIKVLTVPEAQGELDVLLFIFVLFCIL